MSNEGVFSIAQEWSRERSKKGNQGLDVKYLYMIGSAIMAIILIWLFVLIWGRSKKTDIIDKMSKDKNSVLPDDGKPKYISMEHNSAKLEESFTK